MRAALEQLSRGEITFEQFARRTRDRWRSLARYLMRRWRPPSTVGEEDVVQELLAACWAHVDKFDPSRGKHIDQYVIWNSCTVAKRFLHGQRNAHKRSDRSPSRNAVPLSQLSRPDQDESRMLERLLGASEQSLETIDLRARFAHLDTEAQMIGRTRICRPRHPPVTATERRVERIRRRCRIRRRRAS